MAEKLGLGNEVRELKIGQSFTNPKSTGFHTVKYDFKPASVDTNKKATVDVGGNNQVTVTVPHLDGAGVPQTVFKGSQRPYQKECVLIINRVTGEITLEKLGYNIQVKKTRSEYNKLHLSQGDRLSQSLSQGSGSSSDRPSPSPSAAPPHSRSQTPPMVAHRVSNKTRVTSGSRRSAANADHHRPPPSSAALHLVPKHSPLRASPGHPSPGRYGRATAAGTGGSPGRRDPQHGSSESHSQSTLASLPMIGIDDYSEPVLPAPTQTTHNYSQHSHHHSSRSHHNSASASAPNLLPSPLSDAENNGAVGTISDSSSSSSDSDSDSDNGKVAHSNDRNATAYNVNTAKTNGYNNGAVRIDTHLLNDDLCLSESGSDSD